MGPGEGTLLCEALHDGALVCKLRTRLPLTHLAGWLVRCPVAAPALSGAARELERLQGCHEPFRAHDAHLAPSLAHPIHLAGASAGELATAKRLELHGCPALLLIQPTLGDVSEGVR
jgi:hypothetical protein